MKKVLRYMLMLVVVACLSWALHYPAQWLMKWWSTTIAMPWWLAVIIGFFGALYFLTAIVAAITSENKEIFGLLAAGFFMAVILNIGNLFTSTIYIWWKINPIFGQGALFIIYSALTAMLLWLCCSVSGFLIYRAW